jgi:hypothetical protein
MNDLEKIIKQNLEEALKKYIGAKFDEYIEKLKTERGAWVASSFLDIMKTVDFQSLGDRYIITLRKTPDEKAN